MGTSDFLNECWSNEMVPILNGFIFPDGTRLKVSIEDSGMVVSEKTIWTAEEVGDNLTYFAELCRVDALGLGVTVLAGEGGMGSEGVICVLDRSTCHVKWLLFMDSSNPFDKVEIDGMTVVAYSTLEKVWQISIEDPSQVVIGRYVP